MLRFRWILVAALAVSGFALVACGGDDDKDGSQPSADTTPAGDPLSDEAYLRVFCTGLTEYQDSLLTAPTADEIGKVVEEYISNLQQVNPPADLRDYHQRYISYLQSAIEDPTALTVGSPPMPDEDVRDRLAQKIPDIAECKYDTFLEAKSGD